MGSFDTVRHHIVLGKVARRVNDAAVLWLLRLLLKASGKQGVPQGGVVSPPTMWQTFGFRACAEWTRFHAKNHLHGLRSDFNPLDQRANQFPSPRPIRLLQTGGDTLGKLFQIADDQAQLVVPRFLVG
jgi:hypothetical protein